jgi:hypothetical protein
MFKILLLGCAILASTSQGIAQVVNDTLRESIDYRRYHAIKHVARKEKKPRKKVNHQRFRPTNPITVIHGADTVYDRIDYRTLHTFSDSEIQPDKAYTHYLGIQINQLLKLLTNRKAGRGFLSNPYQFVYTVSQVKTGYELGLGLGYESRYSETRIAGSRTAEMAQVKTSIRVGLQKQRVIGRRWIVGAGLDLLFSTGNEIHREFFGGLIQETNQKKNGYGFGPRAIVQYAGWNNRIRMGTELSGYIERQKIENREKFTGLPAEDSRSNSTSITFLQPISLFLLVRIW